MNKKILMLTLVLVLTVSSIGQNGATTQPIVVVDTQLVNSPSIAQTDHNISSYLDFAMATTNLVIDNLINTTRGDVYHSGDHRWEMLYITPSLADYYWAISGLARIYFLSVEEGAPNATISILVSKAATRMVEVFMDPVYPGYYVNMYSAMEARQTKRAGIQAYAYSALCTAERVNASLDFTSEKLSAITCLTDFLYDPIYGGLHFFTLRNGSLIVPEAMDEVYPNDGKRLDHLALGAMALYEAGNETGNSTLIAMANSSLSFMITHMPNSFQGDLYGLNLATNRSGHDVELADYLRPSTTIVSDPNGIAIRALLKGYEVTGDSLFLTWAGNVRDAILESNWDDDHGGFFLETLDGEPYDPTDDEDVKFYKYSETEFQMVLTLEAYYEVTGDQFSIQLILDILDFVTSRLWDIEDGGFVTNGDQEAIVITDEWEEHYTAVQCLGILALERVWSYGLPIISYIRVGPTNPRPYDEVRFSATALDDDGIDAVLAECTIEINGSSNITRFELHANPDFGGIFNGSIDPLPDRTQVNFIIIANDTLGNMFVAGSYYFVVREDIWSPVISFREIYPLTGPRAFDTVIVEFGTYEFPIHGSLTSFQIFWKLQDMAFSAYNFTLVDFDEDYWVWQVLLGQFSTGDILTYYCIAVDEDGNTGQSAFYRLTILGPEVNITPLFTWQMVAAIGLVSAPGVGFAYARFRRRDSHETQRTLKKEARRRARRKSPRRQR